VKTCSALVLPYVAQVLATPAANQLQELHAQQSPELDRTVMPRPITV
jgi:hypothetical protein